ncbi:Glyoxylate reductase [Penicillium daleae]|uniref:Glyoxylate reductase n=1 Tax=Penicillium daleae TaxID=63821 RepID=A0AAD6BWQ3_9EURO|nr:Glyoxylate reductase [Penicillium daleae]KAJ5438319.1 Glyoxylate reductase [Penicillium daleae]
MSPRSDYGDIALSGRGSSVEKKRQRASRACDSCKAKKSRCSGTQPCGPCSLMELECQFTAPYTRGIPKTPPAGDFNWIRSPQSPKRRKSNAQSIDSTLSPAGPHSSDTSHSISPCVESISDVTPQLQETEEHTETPSEQETGEQVLMSDEQGHFVGTSSNVSFFVRLRKRLQKRANKVVPTSIFTFGDAALPDFDSLSFVFPPREIAIELVDKYFIIGSPTYRFLHRGTIEEWLNNAYSPNPNQSSVTRTRNAVLLVVFATATRHFTESYDQHKFQEGYG